MAHSSPLADGDGCGGDGDAFLGFMDYAISVLSTCFGDHGADDSGGDAAAPTRPPWGWVVSHVLKSCSAYSSGVTAAILLSDLFQAWREQHKSLTSKRKPEVTNLLNTRNRRRRLPHTITIDSIHEKNFLSPTSVLEVVVIDAFLLPGTNIYMLTLGDLWSTCTIDLYLHRRYYHYVGEHGILRKGREIFLTGCCLRTATEGSGHLRILPTEYVVILLDEDQDEDAMLLGAQFCTYSFSSISLDGMRNGVSYSFYARIESIRALEPFGSTERKQIVLVDNDGGKIKFLLWGEQVLLANIFSVGSMLALDIPFIANYVDNNREESQELCLEYGSATQIYVLPVAQQEEQVVLTPTQIKSQGTRLMSCALNDNHTSQVTLPRDLQGSVDFSKYPFRIYVSDLHDKMTGVSLYGTVMRVCKVNTSEAIFHLEIEDITGVVPAKLYFIGLGSLGRVGVGHTVYISGLTCTTNSKNILAVSWSEKEPGSSFINLSLLPALLNSSCLHNLSLLSDISSAKRRMHICHVRLDQIEHNSVQVFLCHVLCGSRLIERSDGLECSFCKCGCSSACIYGFQLCLTIADDSGKVPAWCVGQTAVEFLQISPDEYLTLPEDERALYLYTLQNESFVVAIANTNECSDGHRPNSEAFPTWEITRAQRCE